MRFSFNGSKFAGVRLTTCREKLMQEIDEYFALKRGWFKLWRALFQKSIWKQSPATHKAVLIQILSEVNWEPNQWVWKGKKYTCQAGEYITSVRELAKRVGVTRAVARRALKNFSEKYDFLAHETSNESTKITIYNWKKYQGDTSALFEDEPTGEPTDEPTRIPPPTTNKEDKEIKEKKEEKPPVKKDKTKRHPIQTITDPRVNLEALRDFYDDRKERRKGMTRRAITLIVNKLVKHTHEEQRIMVDDAIEKGWQSVFPSSLDKNTSSRFGKKDPFAEEEAARIKKYQESFVEPDPELNRQIVEDQEREEAEMREYMDANKHLSPKELKKKCMELKRQMLSR